MIGLGPLANASVAALGPLAAVSTPYIDPPFILQSSVLIRDSGTPGTFAYQFPQAPTAGNMLLMFESISGFVGNPLYTPDSGVPGCPWTMVANGQPSTDYETTIYVYARQVGEGEQAAWNEGNLAGGIVTQCFEIVNADPDLTRHLFVSHQGYGGQYQNTGTIQLDGALYIGVQVKGGHRIGSQEPPMDQMHNQSPYLLQPNPTSFLDSAERAEFAVHAPGLPNGLNLGTITPPNDEFYSFYGMAQLVPPAFQPGPPIIATTIKGGFRIQALWGNPLWIQR